MALEFIRLKLTTDLSYTVVHIWGCVPPEVRNQVVDKLFLNLANELGLDFNPEDFVTLSLQAMRTLQIAGSNNLVYKFSQCFEKKKKKNVQEHKNHLCL